MYYIIEVQELLPVELATNPQHFGKYKVLGHMNAIFATRKAAWKYIKTNIPCACGADNQNKGASETVNGKRYIVRKYREEILTLMPFVPRDAIKITIERGERVTLTGSCNGVETKIHQ